MILAAAVLGGIDIFPLLDDPFYDAIYPLVAIQRGDLGCEAGVVRVVLAVALGRYYSVRGASLSDREGGTARAVALFTV